MATTQYSIAGELGSRRKNAVVAADSTVDLGADSIRVLVKSNNAKSKMEVIKLLEAVKEYIQEQVFPHDLS